MMNSTLLALSVLVMPGAPALNEEAHLMGTLDLCNEVIAEIHVSNSGHTTYYADTNDPECVGTQISLVASDPAGGNQTTLMWTINRFNAVGFQLPAVIPMDPHHVSLKIEDLTTSGNNACETGSGECLACTPTQGTPEWQATTIDLPTGQTTLSIPSGNTSFRVDCSVSQVARATVNVN